MMRAGKPIKQQQRLVYLGSVPSADGTSGSEISRRMGSAEGQFDKLCRVWKHSGITAQRKLQIVEACIMSKLLYYLHSLCLTKVETRKLDTFHVRCLRRILKIAHSLYGRISNVNVLQAAGGAKCASMVLLERQMLWMGKLAARPDNNPLRQTVRLQSGNSRFEPRTPEGRKRRGQPKLCWPTFVYKHA